MVVGKLVLQLPNLQPAGWIAPEIDLFYPYGIIGKPRTRSSMDRVSEFELDGETENPFHRGKYRPSSLWN